MKAAIFNLSLFLYACVLPVNAQTKIIDSLRNLINLETSGKQKLNLIYELAGQTINSDTLLPYVFIADSIASASKEKINLSTAAYIRSYYYIRKNLVDSALTVIDKLIEEYKNNPQRSDYYLGLLFFRAKVFDRGNRYTQALTQLYKVVQEAEMQKDTLTLIQAKTGIGWVQMEMEQYPEALKWLYKALNTSANKKFYKNYGALYSNIAATYNALHKPDSSQYYINIGIQDARQNNNLLFLATSLGMQAKIFIDNNEQALAEVPLNEVVEIRKKLNDPFYTVFDMSNLASYYAHNNQPEKGITLCKEGILLAKKSGLSSQLLMVYHALAENYKAAGKTVEYGKTLEDIIALKDSFNNINSSKLLADMQLNSDVQKKQQEILEQKLKLTQKNYWLYGSAVFGIMLITITILAFNTYRRREKQKIEIALQEEKRHVIDAVKKAEEKERVRIAGDLHDNLGVYAASMASNLNYIQIPEADEQTNTAFNELKNNSNAIISQLNDTIWVLKKDALSLTAVSDRLKIFTGRLTKSYPDMVIDVEEDIMKDHLLASSHAFHLYRLLQEAVNNALKHSKGKRITVKIIADIYTWAVCINDNGIGFLTDESFANQGNGILNMKDRCREVGWQILWNKNDPTGTAVKISPTTN